MLLNTFKYLANIVGVEKQSREMDSLLDFLVDNIFWTKKIIEKIKNCTQFLLKFTFSFFLFVL